MSFVLSLLSSFSYSFCNDCIVNNSVKDFGNNVTIINKSNDYLSENKEISRINQRIDSLIFKLDCKNVNCNKKDVVIIDLKKNSKSCNLEKGGEIALLKKLFFDLRLYNYSQDRKKLLKRYDSLFSNYKINIDVKDTTHQNIYNIQNIYNHKYKEKNSYKEKRY